jgi:ADP-ribose pyrophosphatase YjhB (NUDIX family)
VFVSQRTDDKEFYPGYWSIVFGGHVHAGESYEDAVLRELKEDRFLPETALLYQILIARGRPA